jgi:hypothetical protein
MGGHWLDVSTQWWVRITGRCFDPDMEAWLMAPAGDPAGIGESFFEVLARDKGWVVDDGSEGRGLLDDMSLLRSSAFDPSRLHPDVVAFYQRTSDYAVDVWSEWSALFKPFGWMLAALFSRRLEQLNVPLGGLDTSRGMTSRVLKLRDEHGRVQATAWVRRLHATDRIIYAGDYAVGPIPRLGIPGVRVAFPLPNGNAVVLMRPEVQADGSLVLSSAGEGFGDAGFYFTLHRPGYYARYLKSFQERIHVYAAEAGQVRADHTLNLFGLTFLRLHYKLVRKLL